MSKDRINTGAEIHPLLSGRWSPRAFDGSRAVEIEKLAACLEAARWSSSCFGDEPWRFIVSNRSTHSGGWQAMFACLAEGNRGWAECAPVLILACAANTFSHNGKPNRWGQYDTGQAMMSLSLQAVAEGLITHPMGGFDPDAARDTFHIPDDFTPMSITALGYAGDPASLAEQNQMLEAAERSRKPMEEIVFTQWGTAWRQQS